MRTAKLRSLTATVAAVVAAVVVLGPVSGAAEDKPPADKAAEAKPEAKGPNTGRVSLSAGVDFPTDYYFRGIFQEDDNYIIEPYGEVGFKLFESDRFLNDVSLVLGTWNSLHGGVSGVDGPNADPKIWYESDFYAKIATTWFEDVNAAVIYTAYMSPNDRFTTVQELALGLGYNDAKLLGPFALNPSILLAFEVKGQADAGNHRGVYLQLGLAPGVTLFEKSSVPLTLSFPITAGLSLSEYYEFGTGNDDTFGYFQAGVAASIPLAFIPPDFGSWQLKASLAWMRLGDNLKAVNNNDRNEIIGTIGLAFSY